MHYDPPRQHQNPYIYVLVYIMCDVSGIYFPLEFEVYSEYPPLI